ncbi:MAG: WD40 repeat domain-containing protein, partial [Chloroflexi bacterium]|nr:WD40 repeat domain-containing protein [Chloroflexota bacterium]
MRFVVFLLVLTITILPIFTVAAQSPLRGPVITPDNAAQLELIATLGRGEVSELLWTPDDKQLIVVSTNALSIYTMGDWDHPQVIVIESPPLIDAALAPDGASIALLLSGQIQIFDTTDWKETLRIETPTNAYGEIQPTLTYTGDYVIHWAAEKQVLLVHDSHTGEEVNTIATLGMTSVLVSGSEPLFVAATYLDNLQYSSLPPDFMLPANNEYGALLLDHKKLAVEPIKHIRGVDYLSDQQVMAVVGTTDEEFYYLPETAGCTSRKWQEMGTPAEKGHLILVDTASESQIINVAMDALDRVALSPAGAEVAVGQCVEWDAQCLYFQMSLLDYEGKEKAKLPGLLPGAVNTLRYSPTGQFLAASNGIAVRVWDTKNREEVALLHGFSTGSPAMVLNDTYLAVGSFANYPFLGVTIWDLRTLESMAYLPCIGAIALHDTQLVCGDELWQIDTTPPRLLLHIPGAKSTGNAAFSSDGSLIALADRSQQTLVLWDVNDQAVVASVSGLQTGYLEFS